MSNTEAGPTLKVQVTQETPEPEPEPEPEPDTEPEGRCEAETTVGGHLYRCALEEGHEDEHRWQVVDQDEEPELSKPIDIEKRKSRLAAEAERHYKRIIEITGEEPEVFHPCELCPPLLAGWREEAAPTEETTKRVRIAIGLPDVSNFAMSPTERVCDDCRGLGKVRTGSMVPARETVTCDACAGKGYVASRPRLNTDTPEAPPPVPENGAPAYPDDGIRRDMFGTPEGDPDFEKLPGARVRPVDYWQQNRA